jgi:hypothetical protein
MRRMTAFLVVCAAALALFLTGCKKNQPPTVPEVSGPTTGYTGATLSYSFSSTDPENQDIAYEVSWGDTSTVEWSSAYTSGEEVTQTHSYVDSGVYVVKVKARDGQLAETEWSDSIAVSITRQESLTLEKPVVTYEVIAAGAALRVSWTAVTNAKSYAVKTDDSTYTTTSLSFDVTVPTEKIEVRAVNGTRKSDPGVVGCALAGTDGVYVYSISDTNPSHKHGLAFDSVGSAIALTLADSNKAAIEFVCDDQESAVLPVGLVNAGDYGWPQNSKLNSLRDAGTTNFDSMSIAPASGYTSRLPTPLNGVFAMRLSSSATWSTNDHFVKAKIQLIQQPNGTYYQVFFKTVYQRIGGLRWVDTYWHGTGRQPPTR